MAEVKAMELPVFEIKQHGFVFYVGYMKAGDLVKAKVDVYSPTKNPKGYQRILDIHRAKWFGRFIKSSENISPPAIILLSLIHI